MDKLASDPQPEPAPLPVADAPITPDQQCTLKAIVKNKVEGISEAERPKGLYLQIWSRFNSDRELDAISKALRGYELKLDSMSRNKQFPPVPTGRKDDAARMETTAT